MLFAVLFTDNPEKTTVRAQYMKAHLSFLQENGQNILSAGPLRDTESGEGAGVLWIVEAPTAERVKELYKSDPFCSHGLRQTVRILQWSQVFANGKGLL